MRKISIIYWINFSLLYFFILLFGITCSPRGKFNNPTDNGIAAILQIGLNSIISNNSGITISNAPISLTENQSVDIGVNFSTRIPSDLVLTIISDNAALTVNGSDKTTLNFKTSNALVAQKVSVKAVDDVNLNSETVKITFTAPGYIDAVIEVVTIDDDVLNFSSTVPSKIGEFEAPTSLNVSLTKQPDTNVTVSISSDNTSAITVSPATLTFSPSNYNIAQSFTLTSIVDANTISENVNITFSASGLPTRTFAITHSEMDYVFGNTSTVTEGKTASLTLSLAHSPQSGLTVNLSSSNTAAMTISPASLNFTSANWNTPQTITLTGVVDANNIFETVSVSASEANSPTGTKSINVRDKNVVVSNISSIAAGNTGVYAAGAIDTINNKLLVAAMNNPSNQRLYLYRCNLDSTGCASFDIASLSGLFTEGNATGYYPSIAFDKANSRILIVANQNGGAFVYLYSCNINLTACTVYIGFDGSLPGTYSSVAVNSTGTKIAIVYYASNGQINILESDGTLTNYAKYTSVQLGSIPALKAVARFDNSDNLNIAISHLATPKIIQFGTSNFGTITNTIIPPMRFVSLAFDPSNTLYYVSCYAGALGVCNGGGMPLPGYAFTTMAIDAQNGYIFFTSSVVGLGGATGPPYLTRCLTNFTGCTIVDLDASTGYSSTSNYFADMVFDSVNNKAITILSGSSGIARTYTMINDF